MVTLKQLIGDATTLVELSPSELAGYILEVLVANGSNDLSLWLRAKFCLRAASEYGDYNAGYHKDVGRACSAAWVWLEVNGLICPEYDKDYCVLTAKGKSVTNRSALREMVRSEELPDHFLHPKLLAKVRPDFLNSHFDDAVMGAFKLLEVEVRDTAGFGFDKFGTRLFSDAFKPASGPLSDNSLESGEQHGLMHLMVGAYASYRNAVSHRNVGLKAEEAREIIILASHLLRIVDSIRVRLAT